MEAMQYLCFNPSGLTVFMNMPLPTMNAKSPPQAIRALEMGSLKAVLLSLLNAHVIRIRIISYAVWTHSPYQTVAQAESALLNDLPHPPPLRRWG